MKLRYLFAFVGVLLAGISNVLAQSNTLSIPDVSVLPGKSAVLSVNLDNTADVVAVQFTLTVPDGVTLTMPSDALSERADDHSANFQKTGTNQYMAMIFSPKNSAFKGRTGRLLSLDLKASSSLAEGVVLPLTLSDVVIGGRDGANLTTGFSAGNVVLAKSPDLTVGNIACDKQAMTPGDHIVASWQVENIGGLPTGSGWSEQISLVSEDGIQSKLIATTHYDNVLNAGGIVSRQAEITLPFLLGIDGQARLQVRVVPDNNTGEPISAQGNNTETSTSTFFVSKMLSLELSPRRVDENAGTRIALKVNRSGLWTSNETFTITATADVRVSIPTTITIPANQSGTVVYFTVNDNEVLDSDSIVNISVTGNDYPEATTSLIIDDNELPALSISASKSEVNEGETFQLTITASRISAYPTTVMLTCENARRFNFPQQVTIPAGETSVSVDVVAIDNDEIELQETLSFKASADKYESGECIVILNDNDMPTLTFTLSPENVSESDGYAALFGVIKRTDNLDKRVTLKLSDDSNGLLSYSTQTIVMAKNQAEVQFSIGVVDNDLVDGNHTVTVTAAVYAASCDCSVPNDTKGVMTATVTIIDDDGPALKIKPAGTSMLEGSESNVFTISHNVQSDKDIKVTISSDKDDMLEYDHELIIPAGQTAANLLVNVKSNDQQDDSSIATFKVEADGYAMGTCWLLITDQTLPDAIVSLYADKTEVEAEGAVGLKAVVKNVGNSMLRSTTPIEIAFSGRKETVKLTIGKAVAVGDSAVVEYNYDLPAIIGEHTFEATVNAAGTVPELIYANNSSEKVTITLLSPFTATAQADKDIYKQGESVTITGAVTGSAGKNANVEVYITNDGTRQTINTTSDADGYYSVSWQPLSKQSGHFTIGACYPGSKATEEMDAFDVYGIKAKDNWKTCELSQTETMSGKIVITNPGNLAQTGLAVTPKAESANCEFTYDVPSSIGAGESIEIGYTIKGNEISEGRDWQQMPVEISTAEGACFDYMIYYFVHSLKAKLETNSTSINTTMTYGTPREYPVTIRNIGKTETGKITLALPDWIQTVTPREMASLAQGDSATIVLRFVPTEAMKLNVRVSGRIGINCANGDGTYISFNLTPVSEEKGTLKVDVIDEYTYFTNEAPHVSKAKVQIKNPATNKIVAEGETADDGTFSTELPEGYYTIAVDAEKHDSYANTVIVDPGVEKEEEVFLSYQAITYSWDVVETEVEDEYEIETIVKYETNVPKPVVIITLPDERPEPNSIIPVIVTNKGLVNALDFNLSLSVSDGYTLEFLNEQSLEILAPQQAHVFYAKMIPSDSGEAEVRAYRSSRAITTCFYFEAYGSYKEPCEKNPNRESTRAIIRYGYCTNLGGGTGGGGIGGPGYPSFGNNSNYGYNEFWYNLETSAKDCDGTPNNGNGSGPGGNGNNDDSKPTSVDEATPDKNENCEDAPVLNYTLISNDGNRYQMKGVAADGVSQVMIVFDPEKKSSIPQEDCEWTCHWSLENDNGNIGTLKNEDSWDGVIYTAPEDFPISENGSSYIVKARIDYSNGEKDLYKIVDIEIARSPLVLLHGLNADPGTWENFNVHIVNTLQMYKDYQVDNTGYKTTNCSHFSVNKEKPKEKIDKLITQYKSHKIVANKADLIGHSMGGILSRLHIQEIMDLDRPNVHKLITVNTPHSGSEIGDLVQQGRIIRDIIDLGFTKPFDKFTSTDAIFDLAVNSQAIADLNNPAALNKAREIEIPVHSVTTVVDDGVQIIGSAAVGKIASYRGYSWIGPLAFLWNIGYSYEMEAALSVSDLVVPYGSQVGGLKNFTTWRASEGTFKKAFHCESPKNEEVWGHLVNLLRISGDNSSFFSKEWFDPEVRRVTMSRHSEDIKEKVVKVSKEDDVIIDINLSIGQDSLFVSTNLEDMAYKSVLVNFGDFDYVSNKSNFSVKIPSTYEGNAAVYAICRTNEDVIYIDSAFVYIEESKAHPIEISHDLPIHAMKNDTIFVRLNCIWDDGSITYVIPEFAASSNNLIKQEGNSFIAVNAGQDTVTFKYKELICECPIRIYQDSDDNNYDSDSNSNSICSTVTLSFKQKNVMTRQAFRGTLTVNNGNEATPMTDVKLNLEVRDMNGNLATSHEFQIDAESLDGFTGKLDLASGWSLGGGETGVATVLFIPTKYAAPTEPKDYSFGGSFSYTDPYTGLTVTRDLNPVTLTVNPSPNLEMTYFMQRDVFGDDPLTETVEPMIPSEFALIVNNKGYGDAENMSLTTKQPEIIDNQKGLAITFELISSQLNGGEKNLSLGGSMTSDFGTIPAHSQAYAQWWLQSSLLGHFIEYDVKATHLTSRNNPDLSLIDTVTIHELIHGFTVNANGDIPLRGFLVNDIKDKDDLPDEVYFTDATQQGVYQASAANMTRRSETEYELNVSAGAAGWNYGSLLDPTYGKQKLVKIIRSDGTEVNVDNIWQTDRTLRDGKDPLYENRLHFVGNMSADGETFYLTFEPKPEVELEVESYAGVPDEGTVLTKQLTELTVRFNKPIKAESFTTEDISINCQGIALDASPVIITKIDEQEYKLGLHEVTQSDGYYVLTVQTANIEDTEGFTGSTGKQISWIQFIDPTAVLEAIDDALRIKITPIPVYDQMYISGNFKEIRMVNIYDMRGVKCLSAQNAQPEQSIYVGHLTAGIYYIQIVTDRGVYSAKVLKR